MDKYVADDYCGGVFTSGFFQDLLKGVQAINSAHAYQNTPKDLPVYLIAGSQDPVGDMGKGVMKIYHAYQRAGLSDVNCKFYEDARHEILNETNREEVVADLLNWFTAHLS